jgi:hypothetical protein
MVALSCLVGTTAFAQDDGAEEPPSVWAPTLSGFVDATYNYNFSQPAGGLSPYHSYTQKHHSFLLNSAHLAVVGSSDSVAYLVEIDAGTDAALNSGGSLVDVQEAWVAYTADSGIGFKAGKFVTYNGIEVIENPANPTISRGFLFGLAEPATHVGALGTYRISDQLDVALGVVNGWDLMVDNNSSKTIVAKFGVTTDAFLLTLSALAGPERATNNDDWRVTFDATGMYKLPTVDLWFQANSGMEQGLAAGGDSATWFGVGVQPVIHLTDTFALGTRLELFDDLDGARTGAEQMLINVSVAPAITLSEHVVMRAEARVDISNEDSYVNSDGDAGSIQLIGLTEAMVIF